MIVAFKFFRSYVLINIFKIKIIKLKENLKKGKNIHKLKAKRTKTFV